MSSILITGGRGNEIGFVLYVDSVVKALASLFSAQGKLLISFNIGRGGIEKAEFCLHPQIDHGPRNVSDLATNETRLYV